MTETYRVRTGTHKEPAHAEKAEPRPRPLSRLLLKQTAAALVFSLAAVIMQSVPLPRVSQCAAALGRALRYETDLSAVREIETVLLDRLNTLLHRNTAPNAPSDGAATEENAADNAPDTDAATKGSAAGADAGAITNH